MYPYNNILSLLALVATSQAYALPAQDDLSSRSDHLEARDTSTVPRPVLGSVPYGALLTQCTVPGVVALTFDDGPSQFTPLLLDMLKAANVPATFFITGNNNGKGAIDDPSTGWPDVIRRTYSEGHQIASHTWTHPYLEKITSAQRIQEMLRNEQAFVSILGFFPTYMRPPYTFCYQASGCLADMQKLGYHLVNLNLDTNDWQNQSPDLIVNSENTVANAMNPAPSNAQFLLLEHDTHEWTVKSLVPFIIKTVKAKGYKFVRVGECFNDPPQNWYRNVTNGQAENPPVVIKNQAAASTASAAPASTSSIVASTAVSTKTSSSHSTHSTTTSTHSSAKTSTASVVALGQSTTGSTTSATPTSASSVAYSTPSSAASKVAVNMVLVYFLYLLV